MEKKILFLDLDGTLLNDEKKVTPGNRLAIRQALDRGHSIVVTTGRPIKNSLAQAERLGLAGEGCFVIAYNGGLVYDCSIRQIVHREALEPEALYRLYDEAARQNVYIQTYDREDVVIEPRCDEAIAQLYSTTTGLDWRRIKNVREDLSQPPGKALLIDFQNTGALDGMERWLKAELAGVVDCFFSSRCFLEVVPTGVNKGSAVAALCRRLGIDIRNSVAAGDESNDISMIRAAGVGVAMVNAIPEAKEAADYITQKDNNHDGIEEVIHRFLL